MSSPGINYQPDDDTQYHEEWLSAYLDGELSAEQRQIVEDRLQQDPATQQLLTELQSVRNLVGGLPVWQGNMFAFDATQASQLPTEADDDTLDAAAGLAAESQLAAGALARSESSSARRVPSETRIGNTDYNPMGKSRSGIWPWVKPLAVAAGLLAMLGVGFSLWQGPGAAYFMAERPGDVSTSSQPANTEAIEFEPELNSRALDSESLPAEAESLGVDNGQSADALSAADLAQRGGSREARNDYFYNKDDTAAGTTGNFADSAAVPESLSMERLTFPPTPDNQLSARSYSQPPGEQAAPMLRREEIELAPELSTEPDLAMKSLPADRQLSDNSVDTLKSENSFQLEPSQRSTPSSEHSSFKIRLQVAHSQAWTPDQIQQMLPALLAAIGSTNADAATSRGLLSTRIPLAFSATDSAEAAQQVLDYVLRPGSGVVPLGDPLDVDISEVHSQARDQRSEESQHLTVAAFLSREEATQILSRAELSLANPIWITARQDDGQTATDNDRALLLIRAR